MSGKDTVFTRGASIFAPIRPTLPSEEVTRRLAAAVRLGYFPKGDKLPSERALAETFEVSRPTVREALRQLACAGIVEVKAGSGGGAFVMTEAVPLELISEIAALRPGEMQHVLEVRRIMMFPMARIAAANAEDDDLDEMREALAFGRSHVPADADREATDETKRLVITATVRFDLAMAKSTRNILTLRLMDTLLRWLEPLRLLTLRSGADLNLAMDVVEDNLRALESGDVRQVDAAIERRLAILESALSQRTGRRRPASRPTQ